MHGEPNPCFGPLHPQVRHGLQLMNRREYFEAHEAIEAAWRAEPGPIRDLYRGILQIAVAYLHITRGNYNGAIKLQQRSHKWLAGWPDECQGIDLKTLRHDFARVMAEVQRLGPEHIQEFDVSLFKPVSCHD
jgi:predicted metal-dependent hydrolase